MENENTRGEQLVIDAADRIILILYHDLPISPIESRNRHILAPLPSQPPIEAEVRKRLLRYMRQDLHRLIQAHVGNANPTRDSSEYVEQILADRDAFFASLEEAEPLHNASLKMREALRKKGYSDFVDRVDATAKTLLAESIETWKWLKQNKELIEGHDRNILESHAALDSALATVYNYSQPDCTYTMRLLAPPPLDFANQLVMVAGSMILATEKKLSRKIESAEDLKTILKETKFILFSRANGGRGVFYSYVNMLSNTEEPFDIKTLPDGRLITIQDKEPIKAVAIDLGKTGCPALGVRIGGESIIARTFERFSGVILGLANQSTAPTR